MIFSRPEKCFALRALKPCEINATPVEYGLMRGGEVFANNAHKIYTRQETGGERKICGRAADGSFDTAERRFNCIECYRANHEKRHEISLASPSCDFYFR